MSRARTAKFAVLAAATAALCAAASCSQDGVTTSCPPLPLYQTYALGDAASPDAMTAASGAAAQELAAAVGAGCATAPNGAQGGGGAGGSSSTGQGGSNSADSAGAAGSN